MVIKIMKIENLLTMTTEQRNPNTMNIDNVSTVEIIEMINDEDQKVAEAVRKEKCNIAKAVDIIAERLSQGGRLIYVGAGTSGRLGIVDASECPPTFGVDFEMIQGVIAGGNEAIFKAKEGAEDSAELGKNDLIKRNVTNRDVICGIAASGRTPYVIGAMKYAKDIGAAVICVTMNSKCEMVDIADIPIAVSVGPEVIMGSTRMKAGTAQKLVLNMLSTGAMIKLGKVYGNLMVDVQSTNEKLIARAKRIVMIATGVDKETAESVLKKTSYDVKLSIFMLETGLNKEEGKKLLEESKGYIQKAIDRYNIAKAT
jgi:N-acetylmuramic acid 6-phosphate etherase